MYIMVFLLTKEFVKLMKLIRGIKGERRFCLYWVAGSGTGKPVCNQNRQCLTL